MPRETAIEAALGAYKNALRVIATSGDCHYLDSTASPTPCDCPVCVAKLALEDGRGGNWRFEGACSHRTFTNPREAQIVDAWRRYMTAGGDDPDANFTKILHEGGPPSPRDWFVATTIIQWLATNVGQTILDEAGYRHERVGLPVAVVDDETLIADLHAGLDAGRVNGWSTDERVTVLHRKLDAVFRAVGLKSR